MGAQMVAYTTSGPLSSCSGSLSGQPERLHEMDLTPLCGRMQHQ